VFPRAADPNGKAGTKTGTKITFKPDNTVMDVTEFNFDTLSSGCANWRS